MICRDPRLSAALVVVVGRDSITGHEGGARPVRVYLMDLYRTRIDPPTGMLSGVILGKIRAGVEQGVAEGLKVAKSRAEAN